MRRWAFLAAVIAGCGPYYPYEPGDRATVFNPWNDKVMLVHTSEGPESVRTVAAGSRVAIVNDPGPPSVPGRMIRVEVLDPPSKGLQGDVPGIRLRAEWSTRAWIVPGRLLITLAAVVFLLLMLRLWLKRARRGIRKAAAL
jgi:hypothetical protein